MRRDYYLHKRKNGIYYVEFIDKASGKKLSARSTMETDKIKAQVKAELWLINGIPTGRGTVPFVQFLAEFWDFDKSEYIQD
jgi:hypothetical protein